MTNHAMNEGGESPRIECGWCGHSNSRDRTDQCSRCGGLLPARPGADPGPEPPPAPRALPADFVKRMKYTRNPVTIAGIAITVILFWSLILPVLGVVLWVVGLKRAKRRMSALESGEAVLGRVLSVSQDEAVQKHGRHPWRIAVAYETPRGEYVGEVTAWDPAQAGRRSGDPLWIVYVKQEPDLFAIWPPVN